MTAARRVLPDDARRGWCPSLARPMPTGDGLLARVHPPLGVLSVAQLRALADGARRFGSGHVDITARGNLQIRGVRAETATGLAEWLSQAELRDVRDDGGPQRLTLTSPLARPGALAIARAIEAEGLRIAGLPAKTLVAIVGAGVSGEGADVVMRLEEGHCAIALTGDERAAIVLPEAAAARAAGVMLRAFAATGRRRVRDLSEIERANVLHAGGKADCVRTPSPSAGEGGPCVSRGRETGKPFPEKAVPASLPPRIREAPSPHPISGPPEIGQEVPKSGRPDFGRGGGFSRRAAIGDLPIGVSATGDSALLCVEAPFGRCAAAALEDLAEAAMSVGAADIGTTPARGFLLACADRDAAEAALRTLADAGFITDAGDPRRAVAACPGAPACASGTTPVPDHAAALARAFAPFAERGLNAHVSGCAKGCAHPAPADLTLVGECGRYGIILNGGPQGEPATRLTFEATLDRVRRADPTAPLAHAFRNPAR